ncbi:MAG: tRNA pseudouridine(55) synthase TruB [Gammaproteobacteria bacterium]|nr:tRNA pseudouridine(55) synthase TruB [Gammaproteobacteria bacterium]MBM4230197.1 tRNA pseudouridine(55) synthase TruB [Gammaproteobacteria bacterium]
MIDGILLLDKPLGLSSTAAGLRVRRLLGASKAGHVGSLDPLATGMLPVCLGEATKLAGEIVEGDKVYLFTIELGARTSTGDTEGEVIERTAVPTLQPDRIAAVLARFVGETQQVPPMYSALKQGGVPLYKRARAGEVVERPPRAIRIDSLELVEASALALCCRVVCGKGTYVRVLAEDIAQALGTVGHVTRLRRESVRPFDPARLVSLETLEARATGEGAERDHLPVVSMDEAVGHLPLVCLGAEAARKLRQGQVVEAVEALRLPLQATVRVRDPAGVFLGLGKVAAAGRIAPKRLVAQKVSEYNSRP